MDARDLFEILVRENAPMLTTYLRCVVRSRAAVDDLFQETFLTAWRNLEKYDRTRPFGPWLRGIAGKLVLAYHRRAVRERVRTDPALLDALEARFQQLQAAAGDTLDEKLAGLRACLDELPETYRETIRLRYQEEMLGERLASRLQLSMENVKKRLQRGRERLLDCLRRKLPAEVLA